MTRGPARPARAGPPRIHPGTKPRLPMTILLRPLRLFNRLLLAVINVLLCVMLATMVIVVVLQIGARLSGTVVIWTSELTQYLLLWITFLGMAAVYRSAGHIAVDICVNRLPQALRLIEYRAVQAVLLVFFAVFGGVAMEFTWSFRWSRAATLDISMFWPYFALPLGSFAALLFAVEEVCTGRPPADADAAVS